MMLKIVAGDSNRLDSALPVCLTKGNSAGLPKLFPPSHALRQEAVAVGLKWAAVRAVLPDWAEDAESTKAGEIELKGFFTRHFGLDIDEAGRLQRRSLPRACFKTTNGTDVEQLSTARGIVTSCAKLISSATTSHFLPFPSSASVMRAEVMRSSGKQWVDLESLVAYCWDHGVPVLYLPNIPTDGRKMEGMVTSVDGRPVIAITKNNVFPDWILFILAHEVGHVANDHLRKSGCDSIVDEKVTEDVDSAVDTQEVEANSYASHLLTGGIDRIVFRDKVVKADSLVRSAIAFGEEHGISPGHVILNVVNNTKINNKSVFGLGMAALKLLPDQYVNDPPIEICKRVAKEYVSLEDLKDDSIDYLEKINIV